MNKLEKQKEIKRRLSKIIDDKVDFGIMDQYSGFSYWEPDVAYYPADFIRVIDEEKGIIEFREKGINKVFQSCVLDLIIDE